MSSLSSLIHSFKSKLDEVNCRVVKETESCHTALTIYVTVPLGDLDTSKLLPTSLFSVQYFFGKGQKKKVEYLYRCTGLNYTSLSGTNIINLSFRVIKFAFRI